MTLSGGQKARVAIARLVYRCARACVLAWRMCLLAWRATPRRISPPPHPPHPTLPLPAPACTRSGADVVLLDDVLSAVDAHVGAALMDKCVCQSSP